MQAVRGSVSRVARRSFVLHDAQGKAAWRGKGGQKCILGRFKGSGRPRVGRSLLGGNGYDEYRFNSMMWAVKSLDTQ